MLVLFGSHESRLCFAPPQVKEALASGFDGSLFLLCPHAEFCIGGGGVVADLPSSGTMDLFASRPVMPLEAPVLAAFLERCAHCLASQCRTSCSLLTTWEGCVCEPRGARMRAPAKRNRCLLASKTSAQQCTATSSWRMCVLFCCHYRHWILSTNTCASKSNWLVFGLYSTLHQFYLAL